MASMEEISRQIRAAGMAAEQKEALPGGLADGMPADAFDLAELETGIGVEMEHTNDRAVAEEIAKDHLAEDPDYYKKLLEMEKKGVDKALFSRFAARRRA